MMEQVQSKLEVRRINRTGAILGLVGGRLCFNQNKFTHLIQSAHHSTIKPILAYGIATDRGLMEVLACRLTTGNVVEPLCRR